MKALKTLALGCVLSAATAASVPAVADDRTEYRRSSFDLGRIIQTAGYDDRYERRRNFRYNRRSNSRNEPRGHGDSRYRNTSPVTVRLNYDANGSGAIPLKRLLRDQHGINPNEWRLRSVNIRNRSRRDACADLSIGGRSTGVIDLRSGVTSISAPRTRSDGRWVLNYENAKVRDVAVILEPRGRAHNRRDDQRVGKYRPLQRDSDSASRDRTRSGFSYNGNRR